MATCTPRLWRFASKVSFAEAPSMILPPLTLDLGLLLISIGVVNLWRARQSSI